MTDTGYEGLRSKAQAYGCSISEYLERLGRGILCVSDDLAAEVEALSQNQEFVEFLTQRSVSTQRVSLEEARKRLNIS